MSDRVLSTQRGLDAIRNMQRIINSNLANEIQNLSREGRTLSDPNVWDGQRAIQFRQSWQETERALNTAREQLEELRARVDQINRAIMAAGGNSLP